MAIIESIEEKAKAYDGLIERLKDLKFACRFSPLSDTIDEIFPELKESEDEKIRKFLITFFINDYGKNSNARFAGIKVKDIISWLEKQGEEKPNPCDGCINRKGCINCENGELRETERKSVWSEEDTRLLDNCISLIEDIDCTEDEQNWLKGIKDRIMV